MKLPTSTISYLLTPSHHISSGHNTGRLAAMRLCPYGTAYQYIGLVYAKGPMRNYIALVIVLPSLCTKRLIAHSYQSVTQRCIVIKIFPCNFQPLVRILRPV
jgi:hypothetical protein